jgi:epoxyqueuosine reductase
MKPPKAEIVKSLALEAGLDAAGIATAEPDIQALERAREQVSRGLKPKWDLKDLEKRFDPCWELAGARSVLVAANGYLESGPESLGKPGVPHGRIARYNWSNYYQDTRAKLQKVADRLSEEVGGFFEYKIFSNGRLAEKPLAVRAGIGWYGKHGIITTYELGSWIVIGLLITNLDLKPDQPVAEGCGDCRACLDACPTGAIVEPRVVDSRRCLQWISSRQMSLSDEIKNLWGDRLYGCTVCQDACPLNKKVRPREKRPGYGRVGPSLPLIPILQMTESEFRQKYLGNQMAESWVSFGAIQRNAAVALGNIGDKAAIPALENAVKISRSPEVREHAAWALSKLNRNRKS